MRHFHRFCKDERGTSAVEYSLIAAMIVLAMIAGLQSFSTRAIAMWNYVSDTVMGA